MNTKRILPFVFLVTLQAVSQDLPKRQTQAECKFSDGKKITISYSSRSKNYQFVTDEDLVTVRGMNIPAGDYTIIRGWDREDHYFLSMRKQGESGPSRDLLRLPLSASTSTLPPGAFGISFDQTGGSCTLHWSSEKTNVLHSLEFTEKNTDLPVSK